MDNGKELVAAIRAEREAKAKWEAASRRVDELIGLVPDKEQRKKKSSKPEDFARACGL